MEEADLERRLRAATDCDAFVAALAEFFTAHGIVFGHGTDNAGDEAYWLLCHLQQWGDVEWRAPPAPELVAPAIELAVRRVVERKPLAYLTKEAWFAGLKFVVDERVLVPRSPLAEVIERGFAPWCAPGPGDRVLDIGTGSGCLAVAVAHFCPDVVVDATDVSAAALAVAATNVARHGFGERVHLIAADLFPPGRQRYRVIVSNPPYVPTAEVATLPPEYRHEPEIGLASGVSGFDAAERILEGAAERLTADGVLFIEVGAGAAAFARSHERLPLISVELERGGDGVFVTTAAEIREFLRGG
jgi:ribosomal protein L3 glutamine methyltransferase